MRSRARCVRVLLGKSVRLFEVHRLIPPSLFAAKARVFVSVRVFSHLHIAPCECTAAGDSRPERRDGRVCREAKGRVEARLNLLSAVQYFLISMLDCIANHDDSLEKPNNGFYSQDC